MKTIDEKKLLEELLGDSFGQKVASDLGIDGAPPELQAKFISEVGETIVQTIALEISKRLPDDDARTFEDLIGAGDMNAIRRLVEPHIPKLDKFIADVAQKEYLLIRTKMQAA